jgi:hypothetical protein
MVTFRKETMKGETEMAQLAALASGATVQAAPSDGGDPVTLTLSTAAAATSGGRAWIRGRDPAGETRRMLVIVADVHVTQPASRFRDLVRPGVM